MANQNKFATNAGGVIKSPVRSKGKSPSSTVTKGDDLRDGKKQK